MKQKLDGTIQRYKESLTLKGYAHKYGIDNEETFSQVAKMATLRVVIMLRDEICIGWI